jgi:hypothetical protein
MNRNQPMHQYANRSQSGTVTATSSRKEPLDAVIDRVMAIAQRVVGAESLIKNQAQEIVNLKEVVSTLEAKIDNLTLKSKGTEFKKPTATKKTTETTESK